MAKKGDLIVVNAARVGGPPREGEIIEVVEGALRVQYRVRWTDGHESLFAPGVGAARIDPVRDRKKTGSEGTETKKSKAKKSKAAKSAAKTAARKSTVRKVAAKKAASRGPSGRR